MTKSSKDEIFDAMKSFGTYTLYVYEKPFARFIHYVEISCSAFRVVFFFFCIVITVYVVCVLCTHAFFLIKLNFIASESHLPSDSKMWQVYTVLNESESDAVPIAVAHNTILSWPFSNQRNEFRTRWWWSNQLFINSSAFVLLMSS